MEIANWCPIFSTLVKLNEPIVKQNKKNKSMNKTSIILQKHFLKFVLMLIVIGWYTVVVNNFVHFLKTLKMQHELFLLFSQIHHL